MLGVGVLGGALYFGITKLEQLRYNTTMADYCGADQISLGQSLAQLRPSLAHAYGDFFSYFKMETGHIGTWLWRLLVLTAVFGLVCRGAGSGEAPRLSGLAGRLHGTAAAGLQRHRRYRARCAGQTA